MSKKTLASHSKKTVSTTSQSGKSPVNDNQNTSVGKSKKELVVKLEYHKPNLFWRVLLICIAIIFFAIVGVITYSIVKTNQAIARFTAAAGISRDEFLTTSQNSLERFETDYQNITSLHRQTTFLLLGTDQVSGREGLPELTDTLLLAQVNADTNTIDFLSIPRDLYNDAYKTRLNALYEYGKERYPDEPERFTREVITDMTGIEINKTFVININNLEQLINAIGGIDINVPVGFMDTEFPREGVDVTVERDPKVLYETVTFQPGLQHMDGETALKYMRSRHASGEEGTDLARSHRQQLVVEALLEQLKNQFSLEKLGKLYRYYLDNFSNTISLNELIDLVTPILVKNNEIVMPNFSFQSHQLPIYPTDENGIIYNPPTSQTQGQWVYKVRDTEKFAQFFQSIFHRSQANL